MDLIIDIQKIEATSVLKNIYTVRERVRFVRNPLISDYPEKLIE